MFKFYKLDNIKIATKIINAIIHPEGPEELSEDDD